MSPVDLIDDVQVTRQQGFEEVNGPALQGLGQDGVIGVGAGTHHNVPGLETKEEGFQVRLWGGGDVWIMVSERQFKSWTFSQPSFSVSTRMRMSSGMARAGWVSFSWIATCTHSQGFTHSTDHRSRACAHAFKNSGFTIRHFSISLCLLHTGEVICFTFCFFNFFLFGVSNLVWQRGEVQSHKIRGAELGGLKSSDDVLQGCCDDKVLLLQPQFLPFKELQHKRTTHNIQDEKTRANVLFILLIKKTNNPSHDSVW